MNKHCYKIVFNKKRGQLMAVAETALSDGKSAGTTRPWGSAGACLEAVLRPLRFSLLLAFGGVSCLISLAEAQIVADPNAARIVQPTVINAANGVPVVNIQTPSAAGVSRNVYSRFDVTPQGAILNNARTNTQTQLGGWIAGNANLAGGTARIILNEVNASDPSQLRGFVEVGGDRAQVVIANPAGVTCSGCGFINASRATLTTGTPIMNGGNLEGYRVTGGTIRIEGNGLDARQTDYTDLIARAVEVNAGLWANQLKVTAGANQVNADNTQATPIAGSGAAPAIGIDVAQLGGMYAGKIILVGTEAGVGVKNAGQIYASAGDVTVTVNGLLHNAGQIASQGAIQADTQNGVQNSGTLYAQDRTAITTRGDIVNSGIIAATNNTDLSATGANSQISNTSNGILGAGVQADGTLGTSGTLTATATQMIASHGKTLSGANQSFATQAIDLSGSQISARNLSVSASGEDIDLSRATVAIAQTWTAQAAKTVRTDGADVAAEQINIQAHDLANVQGQLTQTGTGNLTLQLQGKLDNTGGRLATNSVNMTLGADTIDNTDGVIEHAGTGTLTARTATLEGTRGRLASNGALDLTAAYAGLNAATTSAQHLNIDSSTLLHQGGRLTQNGTGAATITARDRLDNTGGLIAVNGPVTLSVGDLKNQGGTIQATGSATSDLTLAATGEIDNRNSGHITASGQASITGADLQNSGGEISTEQALSVRMAQTADNAQGTLAAKRALSLKAKAINNQAGLIGSTQGAVSLSTTGGLIDNRAGRIEAAQSLSLSATGVNNADGTLFGQSLDLDSLGQDLDNTRGKLIADGTLNIRSGALTNTAGLIQAGSAMSIDTNGKALINTQSGTTGGIVGLDAVTLETGNFDNSTGYLGSGKLLSLTAGDINNAAGDIRSTQGIKVAAGNFDNRGGWLQGGDAIDVQLTGTADNTSGLILAGQGLSVTAQRIDNRNSQATDSQGNATQGLEGRSVALSAEQIDNTTGAIRASQNLAVTSGGTLDNSGGLISSLGTLSILDSTASASSNAAGKTLDVINAGGTMIADSAMLIDAATVSGAGQLLSVGDLSVKLLGDITHTGKLAANRNASFQTTGTLTNSGSLQAGQSLEVKAATLNNAATGQIAATALHLQATDSHTLTNRGLIDGSDTFIDTVTLDNLGTGRIYGDHVAIAATTVNNLAEGGTAPVIAARNRLDIGASTINNREHALLFSAGDLAIGGGLDANHRATGQANELNNASATIESLGDLAINAGQINNTNEHLATEVQLAGTQSIVEYQGSGAARRYTPGTPGVYVYNDESDHLMTPEGSYESWLSYNYTRSTRETRVTDTDPGKIWACGNMQLTANTLNNRDSQIIAGGAITGSIGSLNNLETPGERTITDSGTVTSFWRNHQKGRDSTGSSASGYAPPAAIEAITLGTMVYQANTAPAGSGTTVARFTRAADNQTPGASGSVTAATRSGQVVAPITEVVAANAARTSGPASVIRTASPNTALPDNSLFHSNPSSTARYLVETDPRFANYRSWLASDYMLTALALDPATAQKRLGDGYYEQKLIREQVAQLTGRRFLEGYANDETEYRALMDAGVTVAKAWNLIPGVALSAAQMAQLTTDIVWLVEKSVTLPDGSTQKVLAPQVYARVREGDLAPSGSLIAGNSIDFSLGGDLVNSGSIAGRQLVSLTAENIQNLGGRIAGQNLVASARNNLAVLGGSLEAQDLLVARAGNDLTMASTTRTQDNAQGSRTNIDRVAGLYVTGNAATGQGGTLIASAGNDLQLIAAALANTAPSATATPGSTVLAAGRDLTLGTVQDKSSHQIVWDGANRRSDANVTDVGSTVQTTGNLALTAGRDLSVTAATLTSTQGALTVRAGNTLTVTAGTQRDEVDEAHQHSEKGFLSKKTITTRDTLDQTTALGSSLSGKTVDLAAGSDLTVRGSNVSAAGNLTASAWRDVLVDTAQETRQETHLSQTVSQAAGLGKVLGAVAIQTGDFVMAPLVPNQTNKQSNAAQNSATHRGSTLSAASLDIQSGRDTRIEGSTAVADGAVAITAQRDLSIVSAQNTANSQSSSSSKTTGSVGTWWQPAFGTVKQSQTADSAATSQVASLVASLAGNVSLKAGEHYTQKASDVLAPQGDIDIGAQQIDILAASNSQRVTETRDYQKTAIGGSVSVPLLNAAMSIANTGKAATQTSDPRMQALAAATVAMQAKTVADSAQALAGGSMGGVKVTVSLGTSKNESRSEQNSQTVAGSTVAAGNDVRLNASGAGKDSDLTVQGSTVSAGNNVTLSADNQINLLAAANTADMKNTNSNSGASIGVGFAFGGSQNGWTLELGANKGRGKADGSDVAWTNTQVTAGNALNLTSGGDTTLQGAVAKGEQVKADIGGNLNLASLQDTSSFDAKQQSGGFGLSLCIPPFCYGASTGSVSASGSAIKSDFASVTEQTGIKAGDQGFQVAVKGNTDLTGAVIASTDKAVQDGKNSFTTGGTLTLSDIQNKAEYNASGYAVTLSGSTKLGDQTSEAAQSKMTEADKAAASSKTSGLGPSSLSGAGVGKDSGQASSATQSGISGIAGNTSVRTDDAETGIAKIFDAGKVQKEINAQVTITQAFSQQASKTVGDYATAQRTALYEKLKQAPTEAEQNEIKEKIKDVNLQERVMSVLVGAVTGNGISALTKESLSAAAEQMRDLMIADSQKFVGVVDSTGKVRTNLSGPSEGVRGDGTKVGGTRFDLDLLCGPANERCTFAKKPDGSIDTTKPVQFNGNLDDFIKTTEGQKMLGDTGGLQGYKGTFFGTPYVAGSWQDKLIEAFSGSHDMIGGKLSGLYDERGNIRRGMSDTQRAMYDKVITVGAIPVAMPFAAAEGLSPEVWAAISILLKAAK